MLKVTRLGLVDIGVPFVFAVSGSDGFFCGCALLSTISR